MTDMGCLNIPVLVTQEHNGNGSAMSIYCSVSEIKYWFCNKSVTIFKTHEDDTKSLTKFMVYHPLCVMSVLLF